jgi:hypothetical protein
LEAQLARHLFKPPVVNTQPQLSPNNVERRRPVRRVKPWLGSTQLVVKFEMSSSRPTCRVCRASINPGDGVKIQAAGKELFEVHQGQCQQTIEAGVKTAGTVALNIAEVALQRRVPKALAIFKSITSMLQQLRGQQP